jgi:hypothetical protein
MAAREWDWEQCENARPAVPAKPFGPDGTNGAASRLTPPSAYFGGTFRFRWVGFGRAFGVKLEVLWAVETRMKLHYVGCKHFKWLRKLTGTGEDA